MSSTRVELHKDIVKAALEQAASLRTRNAKAATNPIIKDALEKEETAIRNAIHTLESIPDSTGKTK